MAGEIFISYRRADVAWARRLHDLLRAEGVEAWYDAQVGAGQDWRIATAKALKASKIFVLLFSENAAESSDIAKELAAATLEKKLIVPVRLQNVALDGAFLYELASRNWINAYENTEHRLAEVAKGLAHMVQTGARDESVLPFDRTVRSGKTSFRQGLPRPAIITATIAVIVAAAVAAWFYAFARPLEQTNPLAGARYTRLTDFPGFENDAAISRDGRFVAFRSDRDGTADTWISQIGSGRFINLTRGARPTVLIRNMGFTPDGSEVWLSSVTGGDRMSTIPLLGGAPRPFLSEHAMEAAWSADGKRLVYHPYDGGDPLFVADGTGTNPRQIFKVGPDVHNHFPVWSRDGKWIYFVSGIWNALAMDVWRIRPDGGDPERLTHLSTDIKYLSVLDDRTVVYTAPDENGAGPWLWSLDIQLRTTRRISSGLEVYSSIDTSLDGRRLVASVANPTADMWSMPILNRPAIEADVTPVKVPSVRAFAPRFGERLCSICRPAVEAMDCGASIMARRARSGAARKPHYASPRRSPPMDGAWQ